LLTLLRNKTGHLIWRAHQAGWQIFAEEAGDLNITPAQYVVIYTLSMQSGMDQKTLASSIALDPSTTGNIISRLEERGLLKRTANQTDRRAKLLKLTARGETIAKQLAPVAQNAQDRLLQRLHSSEKSEFSRLLRKVVGLADHHEDAPAPREITSDLSGKRVLLIGTELPLERAIADRLSSDGADVVLFPASLETSALDQRFDALEKKGLRVDVLINSGEANDPGRGEKRQPNTYLLAQESVAMRLAALRSVIPKMCRKNHGRAITLGLFAGQSNLTQTDLLCANSAIHAMTRQIGTDSFSSGVTCNSISFLDKAHLNFFDVIAALIFLASDQARAISGATIQLNGFRGESEHVPENGVADGSEHQAVRHKPA
jgi:DNA-binding MarR family transcriptional regulator